VEKIIGKISRENLIQILDELGIEILSESSQDLIGYCPFHQNRDTPAFNMAKESPYAWRCWNPRCDKSGTLITLVQKIDGMTILEAIRYLIKFKTGTIDNIEKLLSTAKKEAYEIWDEALIDNMKLSYDDPIFDCLYERGFRKNTLEIFEIGYSRKQERITIPVRDEFGQFVGFTGRATKPEQTKKYWDKGLPKKFILFNLDNAKKYDEVIVVEGPLDAMKVYQAGFPNVIAILGGGFTKQQSQKLLRHFQSVIIFTDNDEAGRAFAKKIERVMRSAGKRIFYVKYPERIKDPGEMGDGQIAEVIENKVTLLEKKILEIGIGG
jgi:DNA primase